MAKRRLGIEIIVAAGAIAALVVGYHYGGEIHSVGPLTSAQAAEYRLHRVIAYASGGVWLVRGSYTIRRLANQLGRAIALADSATAASVRLILTIVGLIVVVLIALTILRIGVSQLLLGGAITGVVLGIAAQQSLGNMFAGIVLLVARPFRAGDHVRVRSGALGGVFDGHVVSMGLTYVVFTTDEGTTLVPNLTLLAAGIVRSPRPLATQPPVVAVAGAAGGETPSGSSPLGDQGPAGGAPDPAEPTRP
jgi:small-conductance mechanosensitive channel